MASTLLPKKYGGDSKLRSWKLKLGGLCVPHGLSQLGTMCVVEVRSRGSCRKLNGSSQFVGTMSVAEPSLGSLCVTDVTLPSLLGSCYSADVKRRIS